MQKQFASFVVALLVSAMLMAGCSGGSNPAAAIAGPTPVVVTPTPTSSVVFALAQPFNGLTAGQPFGIKMTRRNGTAPVETITVSSGVVEVRMTSQPDGEMNVWLAMIDDRNVVTDVSVRTNVKIVNGVGNISIPVVANTNYIRFVNSDSSPTTAGVADVSVLR